MVLALAACGSQLPTTMDTSEPPPVAGDYVVRYDTTRLVDTMQVTGENYVFLQATVTDKPDVINGEFKYTVDDSTVVRVIPYDYRPLILSYSPTTGQPEWTYFETLLIKGAKAGKANVVVWSPADPRKKKSISTIVVK